jgi:AIR synthase-related protein
MTLRELTGHLRNLRGIRHKLDIQPVGALLGAPAGSTVAVGDDCAAIADGDGFLLLAIEGLLDEFVSAEPWFAGYCAVMVNVSDVYAMGGRPLAMVDALWAAGADRAGPIWDGMKTAAAKYAVPIVGGHTNSRSHADHLAAAILGRATKLLTSFDARPGDALLAAIDLRGEWFGPHPWWNASTTAEGPRLRADLEILPGLAEAGLCAAAKDISMGGLIGTAAMLAECSGVGLNIDISAIPMPASLTPVQTTAGVPTSVGPTPGLWKGTN